MEYLQSLANWPTEFWLGVALGSFAIFLFALGEFDRPTFKPQPDRPETNFAPPELTSRREYLLSFIMYVVGLEAVYIVMCVIGPAPFIELGLTPSELEKSLESAASFPLWLAVGLVGVLPRLPFFTFIEQSWRRLMHERAAIPHAAISLARKLRRADYDFSAFAPQLHEVQGNYAGFVSAADLDAEQATTSHVWARLSAMLSHFDLIEGRQDLEDSLDLGFIARHRSELDAIRYGYRKIAERIKLARAPAPVASETPEAPEAPVTHGHAAQPAAEENDGQGTEGTEGTGPVPARFTQEIEDLLRRICVFLACALIAKGTSRKMLTEAMRGLGFTPSKEPDLSSELDVLIKGFLAGIGIYFLFVFFAPLLQPLLPEPLANNGWPKMETTDAFVWTFSLLIMHGSAIVMSLLMRRYLRGQHIWFGGTTATPAMPSSTKYLLAAVSSYLVALIVISYWDGVLRGSEVIWRDLGTRYPLALIPTASAFFICLIFDHARVHRSGSRLWPIVAAQVVITSVLALVATVYLYQSLEGEHTGAVAFASVSAGLFALVLGSSTAWLQRPGARQTIEHELEEAAA